MTDTNNTEQKPETPKAEAQKPTEEQKGNWKIMRLSTPPNDEGLHLNECSGLCVRSF